MKKIIFFIILTGCSSSSNDLKVKNDIFFGKDLSFDEFKKKLIKYNKISGYPDLD